MLKTGEDAGVAPSLFRQSGLISSNLATGQREARVTLLPEIMVTLDKSGPEVQDPDILGLRIGTPSGSGRSTDYALDFQVAPTSSLNSNDNLSLDKIEKAISEKQLIIVSSTLRVNSGPISDLDSAEGTTLSSISRDAFGRLIAYEDLSDFAKGQVTASPAELSRSAVVLDRMSVVLRDHWMFVRVDKLAAAAVLDAIPECSPKCAITGAVAIDGGGHFVSLASQEIGSRRVFLAQVSSENIVTWRFRSDEWSAVSSSFPSSDASGNKFFMYSTDRYSSIIVLRATAQGVEDYGSLPSGGELYGRFVDAELVDSRRSRDLLAIKKRVNDCNPDCATGAVVDHNFEWTGRDYHE